MTSPSSTNEAGCSGPVHWDNPEGWDGEGGGGVFRTGDTCTSVADSCQCMAKTTTILYSNQPSTKINKLKNNIINTNGANIYKPFNPIDKSKLNKSNVLPLPIELAKINLKNNNIISQNQGTGYQALSQTAEKGHEQLSFCKASCLGVNI